MSSWEKAIKVHFPFGTDKSVAIGFIRTLVGDRLPQPHSQLFSRILLPHNT